LKALVLTGMAGAGKTEFANYCTSMDIPVFQMGDAVRTRVKQLGLEPTGTNIGRVASVERLKYGSDIWARRTAKNVKNGDRNCVIDGTRSEAEVAYFRHFFGMNAVVVNIYASSSIRYERLRSRGRSDTPMTKGEFEERDRRELGWGLGNAIALADMVLGNEGTIDDFRKGIMRLLKEAGFSK
jgi:dephospho-CoA kinase